MDDAVDRMLKYSLSIAAEFQARLNRIRNYVLNHHPTAGMANEMMLRSASRGPNQGSQFWGCPNYPRCRRTLKYDGQQAKTTA